MEDKRVSVSGWTIAMIGALVAALCVGVYWGWLSWIDYRWPGRHAEAATFASAIAPPTGFLSILALAAAITSVVIQRSELAAQVLEMRNTRKVMEDQEQLARARLEWEKLAERRRHKRDLLLTEATLIQAAYQAKHQQDPIPGVHMSRVGHLIEEVQETYDEPVGTQEQAQARMHRRAAERKGRGEG